MNLTKIVFYYTKNNLIENKHINPQKKDVNKYQNMLRYE